MKNSGAVFLFISEWKDTLLLIPASWHSTLSPPSPRLKEKAKKKKSYFPSKKFNYKALLSDSQSGFGTESMLHQELFLPNHDHSSLAGMPTAYHSH